MTTGLRDYVNLIDTHTFHVFLFVVYCNTYQFLVKTLHNMVLLSDRSNINTDRSSDSMIRNEQ